MNLRKEARRLAKIPLSHDEEVILSNFSEYAHYPLWKIKALYNSEPDYLKPRKLREIAEATEEIKNGQIVLEVYTRKMPDAD